MLATKSVVLTDQTAIAARRSAACAGDARHAIPRTREDAEKVVRL